MKYNEFLNEKNPKIVMKIKNLGEIKLELFPSLAPKTVDNFILLVQNKFYDGLIFHRVIEGFMIQGGDPLGNGMGGAKNHIVGEFNSNGIENPLEHSRGVISMARSFMPNSASSQFFIMHQDAPHLDGQYAAFGCVTSGIEIVDKIAQTPTNQNDCPIEDIIIEKVVVL